MTTSPVKVRNTFGYILPGQTFTKDGRRWIKVSEIHAYPLSLTGMAVPSQKRDFAADERVAEGQ